MEKSLLCAPIALEPGVQRRHPKPVDVLYVPGHQGESMHGGRRGQQTVFGRKRPDRAEPSPFLRDLERHGQDAIAIEMCQPSDPPLECVGRRC